MTVLVLSFLAGFLVGFFCAWLAHAHRGGREELGLGAVLRRGSNPPPTGAKPPAPPPPPRP